jgi:hypothetical protein
MAELQHGMALVVLIAGMIVGMAVLASVFLWLMDTSGRSWFGKMASWAAAFLLVSWLVGMITKHH